MDSLVFDTSALLNFGHRGEFAGVLKRLATEYRLFTTPEARSELSDPARKDYYATFLREHFTVQSAPATRFDVATLARLSAAIDTADITVIALAAELGGIAILDDQAARSQAALLVLRLMGTLGLLHLALQRKWLSDAECLARTIKMVDAKFFIPRPAPGQSFASYFAALE